MGNCTEKGCNAPDTDCSLGELDYRSCIHWRTENDNEESPVQDEKFELRLPWTSMALGLTDIQFISGCSNPKIIGVIGAENAGKTSMLAAWYLMISKGVLHQIDRQFAGSYSLIGWEAIANNLRWEPGQPPCFPAHTPSGSRRSPGLLHMALCNTKSDKTQDYFFADSPGEWFRKWSLDSEAKEVEGARWLAKNADVFLLIADREALSTNGRARANFKHLALRLKSEANGRPIALVWTKEDIVEKVESKKGMAKEESTLDKIKKYVFSILPDVQQFHIHVNTNPENTTNDGAENGLLNLLKWVVEQNDLKINLPALRYEGTDPFFMFGCKDVM